MSGKKVLLGLTAAWLQRGRRVRRPGLQAAGWRCQRFIFGFTWFYRAAHKGESIRLVIAEPPPGTGSNLDLEINMPGRETRPTLSGLEVQKGHFWFYLALPKARSDAGSGDINLPWKVRLVPTANRSCPLQFLVIRFVMVFPLLLIIRWRWR